MSALAQPGSFVWMVSIHLYMNKVIPKYLSTFTDVEDAGISWVLFIPVATFDGSANALGLGNLEYA